MDCLNGLRIDEVIQSLSPVLIQVLQNVVLLQGRIAISHRQEALPQIVVGPSEIELQTNLPARKNASDASGKLT